MVNQPLVTVIIPTYNRAGKITKSIQSVFDQTYPNIQIVVIDDGSTDNTAEVISNFPKVEFYVQQHAGQAAARNYGLKFAKGEFVATLDTDDVWMPEFLTVTLNKLIKDNLDFVFANWLQEDKKGKWNDYFVNYSYIKPYVNLTINDWYVLQYVQLRKLYSLSCPSPSSAVVMRRCAMPSLGWNEEMVVADDWCLYLDMILNNPNLKVAFTKTPLWKKATGINNLMDGRNRLEILKLVYVDDVNLLIDRFKHLLSNSEIRVFEKMKAASLIELAKNDLLNKRFKEGLKKLKIAFNTKKFYSLWAIPNIFIGGLGRFLKI